MDAVIAKARAWAEQDPDPATRAELEALIAARDPELSERFAGPLAFGTAGLRGILGAGESRMNRAVVIRTTAGLCAYLLEHVKDAKTRGVVVGYDGRKQSDAFARDVAAVLSAAGVRVHLSPGRCPTPIVAYGVKELNAAAGVMVTASHNPPEYNGYKVYADNGAQIIAPTDRLIAEAIEAAPPATDVPRDEDHQHVTSLDVERAYLDAVRGLAMKGSGDRSLGIAYTPLHGVGAPLLTKAMAEAGFGNLHVVPEQAEPDGAFPTVAFPNPEEDGAMDLVLALAEKHQAPLVLANDPDADRLAAAVRTDDGYVQLTGNELGVLLGAYMLSREPGTARLVIATIVSSPMLGAVARDLGVRFAETLTGFKWITNRAMELEADEGLHFVFGYEEALGYCVDGIVRDKDGISAAVVLATHAAELHAQGQTLLDELERLGRRHGLYVSAQESLKYPGAEGPAKMAALMNGLREKPPESLADAPVDAVVDVLASTRTTHDGTTSSIELPKSDVLVFEIAGGHRVVARPSGTEPKVKIYVDVRETIAEDESLEDARTRADRRLAALLDAILARL
ncbi:MAG TPA: phospho-sugar mutase [Polyangiaceae bacterium]|nr:phospho-sugar mutase [Polyangiaceae bacterium]